jgi:hypothetical protein
MPNGPSAVSCQQDPDINLDREPARVRLIVQIGALTDYDATLGLDNDGVRLMAATNLTGALKTHPEWFWPGGRYGQPLPVRLRPNAGVNDD